MGFDVRVVWFSTFFCKNYIYFYPFVCKYSFGVVLVPVMCRQCRITFSHTRLLLVFFHSNVCSCAVFYTSIYVCNSKPHRTTHSRNVAKNDENINCLRVSCSSCTSNELLDRVLVGN